MLETNIDWPAVQPSPRRRWESYPLTLRERARYLLLDTIGVALAGRSSEAVGQVRTIIPAGRPAPHDIALLLGTASQALDLDETNLPARCHIAATIIPALIGAAIASRPTGSAFMDALLAGYEFEAHLGQALAPGHGARGWHPSSTLGTFGAAYAASLLIGLDDTSTCNALAIAATQAAGVKSTFGGSAKAFNFGRAAQSGLMAALLAKSGMTAPGNAFLSPDGFFAASGALPFVGAPKSEHPLLHNHFKFLPFCIETHAAALAIRQLADKDGRPSHVRLHLAPTARTMVDRPAPTDMHQARFSVQYVAAATLAGGIRSPEPEPFSAHLLRNAPPLEIVEDARVAHLGIKVVATYADKEVTITDELGKSGHFDIDAIGVKFDRLTAPMLGPHRNEYKQQILALAEASDAASTLERCASKILA